MSRRYPKRGEVFIRRCKADECEDRSLLVIWDGRQIGHVYGWGEKSKQLARALGEAAKQVHWEKDR